MLLPLLHRKKKAAMLGRSTDGLGAEDNCTGRALCVTASADHSAQVCTTMSSRRRRRC